MCGMGIMFDHNNRDYVAKNTFPQIEEGINYHSYKRWKAGVYNNMTPRRIKYGSFKNNFPSKRFK